MSEPIRIVMIEDEAPIRRFLRASLGPDEAEWIEAENGEEGTRAVAKNNPDIILLDLGLPDQDGLDVLRSLREWTQAPIIVLTARGKERDKVEALDAGADDYVTKPFSVPELLARMRVALRHAARSHSDQQPTFECDELRVDYVRREVTVSGVPVALTPIEYKLLTQLATHAGKVLTHNALIDAVWGPAFEDSTHTLRVHMASIRAKIEPIPAQPKFIRTITGVGYRMAEPEPI